MLVLSRNQRGQQITIGRTRLTLVGWGNCFAAFRIGGLQKHFDLILDLGADVALTDEITIQLVQSSGSGIKLGITAPRHIPIARDDMVKTPLRQLFTQRSQT